MAEGKESADWNRAADLMALTANIHRDAKKGRAFRRSDFHPFAPRASRKAAGIERERFIELAVAEAKKRQPRRR